MSDDLAITFTANLTPVRQAVAEYAAELSRTPIPLPIGAGPGGAGLGSTGAGSSTSIAGNMGANHAASVAAGGGFGGGGGGGLGGGGASGQFGGGGFGSTVNNVGGATNISNIANTTNFNSQLNQLYQQINNQVSNVVNSAVSNAITNATTNITNRGGNTFNRSMVQNSSYDNSIDNSIDNSTVINNITRGGVGGGGGGGGSGISGRPIRYVHGLLAGYGATELLHTYRGIQQAQIGIDFAQSRAEKLDAGLSQIRAGSSGIIGGTIGGIFDLGATASGQDFLNSTGNSEWAKFMMRYSPLRQEREISEAKAYISASEGNYQAQARLEAGGYEREGGTGSYGRAKGAISSRERMQSAGYAARGRDIDAITDPGTKALKEKALAAEMNEDFGANRRDRDTLEDRMRVEWGDAEGRIGVLRGTTDRFTAERDSIRRRLASPLMTDANDRAAANQSIKEIDAAEENAGRLYGISARRESSSAGRYRPIGAYSRRSGAIADAFDASSDALNEDQRSIDAMPAGPKRTQRQGDLALRRSAVRDRQEADQYALDTEATNSIEGVRDQAQVYRGKMTSTDAARAAIIRRVAGHMGGGAFEDAISDVADLGKFDAESSYRRTSSTRNLESARDVAKAEYERQPMTARAMSIFNQGIDQSEALKRFGFAGQARTALETTQFQLKKFQDDLIYKGYGEEVFDPTKIDFGGLGQGGQRSVREGDDSGANGRIEELLQQIAELLK